MTLGNPYQTLHESVDLLWGFSLGSIQSDTGILILHDASPRSLFLFPFLGSRANISQNELVTFSLVLGLENTGIQLGNTMKLLWVSYQNERFEKLKIGMLEIAFWNILTCWQSITIFVEPKMYVSSSPTEPIQEIPCFTTKKYEKWSYPPETKRHNPWKLIVGRWNFLLKWSLFMGHSSIFFWGGLSIWVSPPRAHQNESTISANLRIKGYKKTLQTPNIRILINSPGFELYPPQN